jgi:hypothetical protein
MDNGASQTLLAAMLVLLGALPAQATPGAGPAPPSPPPIAVPFANPGNLVLNGGFETGTYTPQWTLAPGGPFDNVCLAGATIGAATCVVHSGQYAMSFGLNGGTDSLSQNIPTVPGKSYVLSFFLANVNPLDQNITTFQVFWDGASVYSLPSPQPTFPYRQVILNVTATTASTPLTFVAQQDPSQWFLDDVSVTLPPRPPATVPTLTEWSVVLMALLVAGVAAWQIRRRLG